MLSCSLTVHCFVLTCMAVSGTRVSTDLGIRDAVKWGKSKSTHEMVIDAVKRACIEDFGREYENMLRSERPDLLPTDSREVLFDLLGQRWALEDAVAVDPGNKTLKEELGVAKAMIKNRLFSVTYVGHMCGKYLKQPREDVVRDCVLGHVENATTVKRSSVVYFPTLTLDLSPEQKVQLSKLIKARWSLQKRLRVLSEAGAAHLSWNDRSMLKTSVSKEHEQARHMIKTFGFSLYHTTSRCKKEVARDSLSNSASIMARIAGEINGPVAKQHGSCAEISGDFCPEGTSPQSKRGFDSTTFGTVYAGTFAVFKPASMGIGFVVGFLIGGPALGAAFAAGAAIPGPAFVVPVPIAAAAATDWFPKCRCFPNECVFDEHLRSCAMAASGKSSNPFERLPYPGQKCVPAGEPGNDGIIVCKLQACSADDYAPAWEQVPIFGSVGTHREETRNCLSSSGNVEDSLLLVDNLPGANGGTLNNTVGNRTALYKSMGVQPPITQSRE